ncbi:hypothetical protein BCR34DRAFT_591654 [Clohesyomyces aquaticus]|uniref:Uncharacterized protein n=1 Tax=Clohesyomyces aquaticus TaxID=1231657 RepID=A0A1Y1YZV2_9PLEO|nr:hypothetical protein BCR34DRAFT_591654 [Clohesyomyces aquaticus]
MPIYSRFFPALLFLSAVILARCGPTPSFSKSGIQYRDEPRAIDVDNSCSEDQRKLIIQTLVDAKNMSQSVPKDMDLMSDPVALDIFGIYPMIAHSQSVFPEILNKVAETRGTESCVKKGD